MARKQKINGRIVPRGIVLDEGLIYVRLWHEGRVFKKCLGNVKQPGILDEAIARLNQYREQIRLRKFGLEERSDRITVEAACDLYFKLHGANKKSADSYGRSLRYIKGFFSGRYLDSITYLDIQNYRREREKHLSPSSVNREHTVITHLFNAIRKWRRLKVIANVRLPEENPGSLVPRTSERQFRRKRVLTPEEFDRFLKSAPIQVRRICLAAVHTALRFKDLRMLTRENVNWSTNQLEGVQAKTGRPYSVPITGLMRKLMETASGRQFFDFRNFRKQFEAARNRSGLDFQFRDLRRTAGRMMLQKGVDLATVSSYLGHTTIAMTESYVQAERENKQVAGEILGSMYQQRLGDDDKLSGKLSGVGEKFSRPDISKEVVESTT